MLSARTHPHGTGLPPGKAVTAPGPRARQPDLPFDRAQNRSICLKLARSYLACADPPVVLKWSLSSLAELAQARCTAAGPDRIRRPRARSAGPLAV